MDGISLTVVDCGRDFFTIAVIPHTLENTNLGSRKLGDRVNIEPDILAKYVEGILPYSNEKRKTTKEFLKENGFID